MKSVSPIKFINGVNFRLESFVWDSDNVLLLYCNVVILRLWVAHKLDKNCWKNYLYFMSKIIGVSRTQHVRSSPLIGNMRIQNIVTKMLISLMNVTKFLNSLMIVTKILISNNNCQKILDLINDCHKITSAQLRLQLPQVPGDHPGWWFQQWPFRKQILPQGKIYRYMEHSCFWVFDLVYLKCFSFSRVTLGFCLKRKGSEIILIEKKEFTSELIAHPLDA